MIKVQYNTPGMMVRHHAPGRMLVRVPSPVSSEEGFAIIEEAIKAEDTSETETVVHFDIKRALNIYLRALEKILVYPGRLEYLGLVSVEEDSKPVTYLECYTDAEVFKSFCKDATASYGNAFLDRWLHCMEKMAGGSSALPACVSEVFAIENELSTMMRYWALVCLMQCAGVGVNDVLRMADEGKYLRTRCVTPDAWVRADAMNVVIESPLDFEASSMDLDSDVRVWLPYKFGTSSVIKKAVNELSALGWKGVAASGKMPYDIIFNESRWAAEYTSFYLTHCGVPEYEIKFEGINHTYEVAVAVIPRLYFEDWLHDLRTGKMGSGKKSCLYEQCVSTLRHRDTLDFTPYETSTLLELVLQHKNDSLHTPEYVAAKLLKKHTLTRYTCRNYDRPDDKNCYIDVVVSDIEYDVDFEEDYDLLSEGAPEELQDADGETLFQWHKDNGEFPEKMCITVCGLQSDLVHMRESFMDECVNAVTQETGWCVKSASIESAEAWVARHENRTEDDEDDES